MNPALRFIRTTVIGGILFLLPLVVLFIIFEKAHALLSVISDPISRKISDSILGFDGSALISILLLILICFMGGLVFRSKKVKKILQKLEDKVLIFIPGYSLIKSVTADTLGEDVANKLIPVRVADGEDWLLGFLIEEAKNHSTVFLPDAPKYDAGEIRIMPTSSVVKMDIPANKFTKMIRSYGVGVLEFIE